MAVRRVIVAGGGVAGAVAALALLKVGIEAEVYEAHPSGGADAGAFLTVMRNGMAALVGIGAAEAVDAVSFPARAVALLDGGGGLHTLCCWPVVACCVRLWRLLRDRVAHVGGIC